MMLQTATSRSTFGSSDVEKVHANVARSAFRRQSAKNITCSRHFWTLKRRFVWQAQGILHSAKSEQIVKVKNTQLQIQLQLRYITQHYATLITLHYATTTTATAAATTTSTTLHYVTLRYTTLHYVTLRYTTLHYVTLRYTTLHYVTLRYTTLHYTTLHYPTLHFTSLHYTTLHCYRWFIDRSFTYWTCGSPVPKLLVITRE